MSAQTQAEPRPIRCGWCMTGDHEHCPAVLVMGLPASRKQGWTDASLKRRADRGHHIYAWRCKCWECDNCQARVCANCRRSAEECGELKDDLCVDTEACRNYHKYPQPAQPHVKWESRETELEEISA